MEVLDGDQALSAEADRDQASGGGEAAGEGSTIPHARKGLRISEQTFYRWRIKFGALTEDEARPLQALEQEHSRLTKIVAEQALDISTLKVKGSPSFGPS